MLFNHVTGDYTTERVARELDDVLYSDDSPNEIVKPGFKDSDYFDKFPNGGEVREAEYEIPVEDVEDDTNGTEKEQNINSDAEDNTINIKDHNTKDVILNEPVTAIEMEPLILDVDEKGMTPNNMQALFKFLTII